MWINPRTGLVAVKMLKSSASRGFVEGEVRGFEAEAAEKLIKKKWAADVSAEAEKVFNAKAKAKAANANAKAPALANTAGKVA